MKSTRNQFGFTLPFALILTFIFSALVGVSYLFVSINIAQMQSGLENTQAIAIAEGINERVKARLNTKSKLQQSPKQQEKLKSTEEEPVEGEEEEEIVEEDFDENVEDFDEYYADEILKISRYITFREPPDSATHENGFAADSQEPPKAEANIEMIGSINISRGTTLNPGMKLVVFKNEKIDLMLKDILLDKEQYRSKLPTPVIKSLSPNYSEADTRGGFVIIGDNLTLNQKGRFNNKDIYIEDIKGGPTIEYLISMDVMPGIVKFYWDSAQAEFYITPPHDRSPSPVIEEVRTSDGSQLLDVKAGQKKIVLMILGRELYQNMELPVIIPDVAGLIPKTTSEGISNKEITLTLDIARTIEPGIHSLIVVTEGGLSNSWLFNIQPPDKEEVISSNTAIISSSLTLLKLRVIENLLPLIDENEALNQPANNTQQDDQTDDSDDLGDDSGDNESEDDNEDKESAKLSPFANVDLETSWLLETTVMVGKVTRTISEVVERQIPDIHAALLTNGNITFDGGGYQIVGATNAMTNLVEPTYISNIILSVPGPKEEPEVPLNTNAGNPQPSSTPEVVQPKSPTELGFASSNLVAVVKEGGDRFNELDYASISNVGRDTIELVHPGLMDFHYEGDQVTQFIPPIISNEKLSEDEQEKHTIPQGFSISIPHAANFRNVFMSNLEQFAELADLYSNDANVPKDKFELPVGYMGLSYIEATPTYDQNNTLAGKGILIVDTRIDNQGNPSGVVEISGDSKSPVDFAGIVYIHGDLRLSGNVTINGALIVDNESNGQIQIASNAIGKIVYNPASIKQTLLYTPFTTRPGTIMITNTPIDLSKYIESSPDLAQKLGASPSKNKDIKEIQTEGTGTQTLPPEEALVEAVEKDSATSASSIFEKEIMVITGTGTSEANLFPSAPPSKKTAEEELIDLF